MKKIRIIMLSVLMLTMMCILSGCADVRSEVIMDEEGKGVVNYKIEIEKNGIEKGQYTNFKTIEEMAEYLQSKIDPETNLKVSTDKISSETKDYIIVSQEYDSTEQYNDNINTVLQKYNLLVVEDDVSGMIGYNPYDNANKNEYEILALKEYLESNGIEIDTTNRNVRKFIKVLKPSMYIGDTYEENRLALKSSEDEFIFEIIPDVEIIESGSEKNLKISSMAFYYIEMYMRRILQRYSNEIFNKEYIKVQATAINGEETKEILKETFANIDLASKIKASLDAKFDNKVDVYSMNDFSPVLAVKLFDKEFSEKFNKEYNTQYNAYQEQKEAENNNSSIEHNLEDELYKERETTYEITFGGNTVVLTKDEFYEKEDEYNRITISSTGDVNSNEKEVTSEGQIDGVDESPFTGDKTYLVGVIVILSIAFVSMTLIITYMRSKNS